MAGNILSAINRGGKPLYTSNREEIAQRAAILLRDVEYVVEAHFEMTPKAVLGDNEGKFGDTIMRRLCKDECYHRPYFGCREFPTQFALHKEDEIGTAYTGMERSLGYMLSDFDCSDTEDTKPMFFRAVMKDGVLDIRDCEVVQ